MKRFFSLSVLSLFLIMQAAGSTSEHQLTTQLLKQFTPSKPTVVMTYEVNYRLLGMKLLRVAQATIETTEGFWRAANMTNSTPCCFIDIILTSIKCDAETRQNGRIYINDRICTVATMPDLNTLYYVKRTDEYINPPFVAAKRIDNIAVYNLAAHDLDFYSCDYLTGEVVTNMTAGAEQLASQGKEVAKILQMLSNAYHGRQNMITPDSDFRLQINCDGVAIPFAARTQRKDISLMGYNWPVLRAEVMPAREAPKIKSRPFTMWATSFSELARQLDDPVLLRLAAETPAWGMTPLLADYGLALGSIRCSLSEVSTRTHSPFYSQLVSHIDPMSIQPLDSPANGSELEYTIRKPHSYE